MKKILIILGGPLLVILGVGAAFIRPNVFPNPEELSPTGGIACTTEAKICPDGSTVTKVGTQCEFELCAVSSATSTKISTTTMPSVNSGSSTNNSINTVPENSKGVSLNQSIQIDGVTITPIEVVGDNRCPTNVQCIVAGSVTIQANIQYKRNGEIKILQLGQTVRSLDQEVTLQKVLPAPSTKETIKKNDYRFYFTAVHGVVRE